MAASRRRVVITGAGCVTSVGNDLATTWQALLDGKSGGGPITRFDATAFKVRFACEVKGFDPSLYMDRKEIKRSDLYTQYAMAASVQAMRDAGFGDGTGYEQERMGVVIGSGIGGIATFEDQCEVYRTQGPNRISPFFIPMFIGDIAAGVVSMRFQAKGPNYATQSACATSAHAIGDAFRMIVYGDADLMIAGGSEAAVSPVSIGGFGNMQALSTRNESPETASRPFDQTRDGFVLGEGAGCVVMEEYEHARRRGAPIYAEVVGYGATGDAYHLTGQPEDHEGLQRAMRRALEDGGLSPADVQYVNAHGTSTPLGDDLELQACERLFGEAARTVAMSSTKSSVGHLLGAAGAVEAIFSILAVRDNVAPPTLNLDEPSQASVIDRVALQAQPRRIDVALSNSFGFGGTNASILFRKAA